MSQPIFPLQVWTSQITQASIPANENALRVQVLQQPALAIASAQPSAPAENDLYIIGPAPTGAQWAAFNEGEVAVYKGGSWLCYSPFAGWFKAVGTDTYIYQGSAWQQVLAGDAGSFTALTDTPDSYTGAGGKLVAVKGDETGLELIDAPAGGAPSAYLYDVDPATSGLSLVLRGGQFKNFNGSFIEVAQQTVLLLDDAVNFVQLQRSNGAATANQEGFNFSFRLPLYKVTTSGGAIVSTEDWRQRYTGAVKQTLGTSLADYEANGGTGLYDLTDFYDGRAGYGVVVNDFADGAELRPLPYKTFDITDKRGATDPEGAYGVPLLSLAPGPFWLQDGTRYSFPGMVQQDFQSDATTWVYVNKTTGDVLLANSVDNPTVTDFPADSFPLYKVETSGGAFVSIEDHRNIYAGGASLAFSPVVNVSTSGSVLLSWDQGGKFLEVNASAPATVTVPSTAGFSLHAEIHLRQVGTGSVTLAADAGVTIQKPASQSLALREQYAVATLKMVGTDTWALFGMLGDA